MIYFLVDVGADASLETATGIRATMIKCLRSAFYTLNSLIYELLSFLYNLFEILCNARFLSNENLSIIATKVGLLLGVIMLFSVTINFIQILLNPDKINNEEIGVTSILKKVIELKK